MLTYIDRNKKDLLMVEKVGLAIELIEEFFDEVNRITGDSDICSLQDLDITKGYQLTVGRQKTFFTKNELEDFLDKNYEITDNELETIYKKRDAYIVIEMIYDEPSYYEIDEDKYFELFNLQCKCSELLSEINDYYENGWEYYLDFEYNIENQVNELYDLNVKYSKEVDSYKLKQKLDLDLKNNLIEKKLNKI